MDTAALPVCGESQAGGEEGVPQDPR